MGASAGQAPGLYRLAGVAAVAAITLIGSVAFSIVKGDIERSTAIVTCTATGGLVKYAYCNWQEPTTNAGSGSKILAIHYAVGDSPVVVGVDFTTGGSSTASGTGIVPLTNFQTATGAYAEYISGSVSGSILMAEGDYLRGITLTDPTASHTATVIIKGFTKLSHD